MWQFIFFPFVSQRSPSSCCGVCTFATPCVPCHLLSMSRDTWLWPSTMNCSYQPSSTSSGWWEKGLARICPLIWWWWLQNAKYKEADENLKENCAVYWVSFSSSAVSAKVMNKKGMHSSCSTSCCSIISGDKCWQSSSDKWLESTVCMCEPECKMSSPGSDPAGGLRHSPK